MSPRRQHSRRGGWTAGFATLGLIASTFSAAGAVAATPTDLFVSEYVEGGSGAFAKAVEIYNGTAGAVDLAAGGYAIAFYTNGSVTPSGTITLSGSIASGDVFVIANPTSAAAVLAAADQTSVALNYNGNDALLLVKGGITVDAIGQVGVDPGATGWGTGLTSTVDHTLRRAGSVTAGDAVASDAFDPALEWIGFSDGTYDGLGVHAIDGGGRGGGGSGTVSAEVTLAAAAACIELSASAIDFGTLAFGAENMPATPNVTVTNCSTTAGTLLASGSNATGTGASWSLVDNSATCAGALGTNNYRLGLASPDLAAPLGLALGNKTVQSLAAGAATTHTARIWTACSGSTGDGQTLSIQINYLATTGG